MVPVTIDFDIEDAKRHSDLLPSDPAAHYAPTILKGINFGDVLHISDDEKPVIAYDDNEDNIARNQPKETSSKVEFGRSTTELKWTRKLESEFDDLAAKYALEEISTLEEEKLAELLKVKRMLARKKRTAAEVLHEIQRKKDERELVSQINGFLQRYAAHA